MAGNSDEMLKLIHDTKALSIWDRKKGPIFWYTAGVPGPFFVNTEWIIGRALAASLVDGISKIIESTQDHATRAKQVDELVLSAFRDNLSFRQVIAALVQKTKDTLAATSFDFISGGERRDWIFSIPLARELGLKHVFLFKDQSFYCDQDIGAEKTVLHVADLINNAASYFERWLPALEKAGLHCHATLCVNSRGNGAEKLEKISIKVAALAHIDIPLFESLHADGLIDTETLDELRCHARSPKEWAETYLIGCTELFDVAHADKKSFERMQSFFAQDPWALREKHAAFFRSIEEAIAARLKQAA